MTEKKIELSTQRNQNLSLREMKINLQRTKLKNWISPNSLFSCHCWDANEDRQDSNYQCGTNKNGPDCWWHGSIHGMGQKLSESHPTLCFEDNWDFAERETHSKCELEKFSRSTYPFGSQGIGTWNFLSITPPFVLSTNEILLRNIHYKLKLVNKSPSIYPSPGDLCRNSVLVLMGRTDDFIGDNSPVADTVSPGMITWHWRHCYVCQIAGADPLQVPPAQFQKVMPSKNLSNLVVYTFRLSGQINTWEISTYIISF